MGRINGTFRYTVIQDVQKDPATGFVSSGEASVWLDGCECQIDKSIPAKQIIGTDGQTYAYSFDVFIPKYFNGDFAAGAQMEITSEEGVTEAFTIQGVDDMNRKYTEVWG